MAVCKMQAALFFFKKKWTALGTSVLLPALRGINQH